tara:strand:+ start:109 stop:2058 length:1950 start_codon:yes stop_codon:yes gene_type:complete
MPSDETATNPIEPRRRRISAESFRTGRNIAQQNFQTNLNNRIFNSIQDIEIKTLNNERKITSIKNILGYQKSELKENLAAVSPQAVMLRNLDAILETIRADAKLEKKDDEYDRRKAENTKRRLQENKLEKRYEGLRKTTEKILAPVRGIIGRIVQAFLAILAGKFIVKLIDFVGDPKNQKKINSVIRFFSDNGPKLLTAYLMFGTRFGRAIGKLSALIIRSSLRIGAATLLLLKKFGLRGAGGLARNLLGPKGRAVGTALQVAGTAATFLGIQNLIGGAFGGGEDQDQEVQGLYGGGIFTSDGLVDGPYGYDKVNARLTDGEFVMSAPAVAAIGPSVLERINAKYGGDNTPRMVSGKLFANEGGLVNNDIRNFAPGLERLTAARTGQAGLGYYMGQIMPAQTGMSRTDGRSETKLITSSGPIERRLPTREELSTAQKMRGFLKPGQMSGSKAHYRFPETGVADIGLSSISRGDGFYSSDSFSQREMYSYVGQEDIDANKKQLMSMFPQGTTLKNILNYNVAGMSPLDVHRAFVSSDAYKATEAKKAEAERMYNEDLTAIGVDISKPYMDAAGVIKQDGKVFANTGIFGFNEPKVLTPEPPMTRQPQVMIMNTGSSTPQPVGQMRPSSRTHTPVPLASHSSNKVKTLGLI